jgi:hypothetical protein
MPVDLWPWLFDSTTTAQGVVEVAEIAAALSKWRSNEAGAR